MTLEFVGAGIFSYRVAKINKLKVGEKQLRGRHCKEEQKINFENFVKSSPGKGEFSSSAHKRQHKTLKTHITSIIQDLQAGCKDTE